MKTYEQIAKTVLARRDEITRKARIKAKYTAIAASAVCACVCIGAAVIGYRITLANRMHLANPTLTVINDSETAIGTELPITEESPAGEESAVQTETLQPEQSNSQAESGTAISDQNESSTAATEIVSPPDENPATTVNAEIAIVPHWDEMPITQQFAEFEAENGVKYRACGTTFSSERIVEQIGGASLEGSDIYTDTWFSASATVYAVSGFDPDYVRAIRFTDPETDEYYAYMAQRENPPETLGALIDAVALDTELTLGDAYTAREQSVIPDYDRARVLELLLACRDAAPLSADYPHDAPISLSASIPALGVQNHALKITADGLIWTNIFDFAYVFDIGADAAGELLAVFDGCPETPLFDAVTDTEPVAE